MTSSKRWITVLCISLVAFFLDYGNGPQPDTTFVILNWSRLPNVNKIISNVCDNLLEDVISSVTVWNNSPRALTYKDFPGTPCPESKLTIVNSGENLYFQARYIACAQADSQFCFIQDDDYLVKPEIIRALHHHIRERNLPGIHLQPPFEMLSSELKTTLVKDKQIHTTFAWLGYGTIVQRKEAVQFISLMDKLQFSDDERKMADNYFSILSNRIPERWIDEGIELGGGQPFTVGTEGQERNDRHILRAAEILDNIVLKGSDVPYVSRASFTNAPTAPFIHRAPCFDRSCVFQTSIRLTSEGPRGSAQSTTEILDLERRHLHIMGDDARHHYLRFPPCNAVDNDHNTAFQSPK
ncbi:hypothetical protein BJ165DRAFT_451935 [Panaeolus papilionaceus]|nr:hypothetical protein BJ165DRAFT_451935 [Panaeolus papilionaceus]